MSPAGAGDAAVIPDDRGKARLLPSLMPALGRQNPRTSGTFKSRDSLTGDATTNHEPIRT